MCVLLGTNTTSINVVAVRSQGLSVQSLILVSTYAALPPNHRWMQHKWLILRITCEDFNLTAMGNWNYAKSSTRVVVALQSSDLELNWFHSGHKQKHCNVFDHDATSILRNGIWKYLQLSSQPSSLYQLTKIQTEPIWLVINHDKEFHMNNHLSAYWW